MLYFVSVNWMAVAVAMVAAMAIGFLWYSPMLFAKSWLALTPGLAKRTKAQVSERMGKAIGVGFVANLVMAYALAVVMRYTGAHTPMAGVVTGLWVGIGFFVPVALQGAMYSWKPLKLVAIDEGYLVLCLVVMGAIIGAM